MNLDEFTHQQAIDEIVRLRQSQSVLVDALRNLLADHRAMVNERAGLRGQKRTPNVLAVQATAAAAIKACGGGDA